MIPILVKSRGVKYFRKNLVKEMKDQYTKKNKILFKEMEDAKEEKVFCAHWTEKQLHSERNLASR